MPFWKSRESKTAKEKINYKARLEHKQYLAEESPEPVYDLSECGLKSVPPGVSSKCKVRQKEALLLQQNELTLLSGGGLNLVDLASVLRVLDVSCNQLEKLPEEIGVLGKLRVLNLSFNKLRKLPESLGELSQLNHLNLAGNILKTLPASLCNLGQLRTLDLTEQKQGHKLTRLDRNLHKLRALDELKIDAEQFVYPDKQICSRGTEAIMRFLCKECDSEYVEPAEYRAQHPMDGSRKTSASDNGVHEHNADSNGDAEQDDPYEKMVRGSLKLIQKQKEEKLRELQAVEREREAQQQKELELAATLGANKRRLLTHLAAEEARREQQLKKVQVLKEQERERLLSNLSEVEASSDALIAQLVSDHRLNDEHRVLEEMERERREMEEHFTIKAGEENRLREKEVLREMQRVMEDEVRREQLRRQYDDGRRTLIESARSNCVANDKALEQALASKGARQKSLISELLEDEKYQREAFAAQFVAQDARHAEMSGQMERIQSELANLTMVEMTKKDLKMEFEREVMAEKREMLTKLLVQLMTRQEERKQELQKRMNEMEDNRSKDTENYWLIQYQKLLDAKPKSLSEAESSLEPELQRVLEAADAKEYAPILATRGITLKQLTYMNDRDLLELGVHNTYLRQRILMILEQESKLSENKSEQVLPSAPPPSEASLPKEIKDSNDSDENGGNVPSAPPVETFRSTECVICIEKKCDIIFLPCGHVCCCWKCEPQVSLCPLCRAQVSQKVRV